MANERKKKHWIQDAIQKPGSLTAAAKRAHETVDEFARRHEDSPGKVGQRSRFYLDVLLKANRKKKS